MTCQSCLAKWTEYYLKKGYPQHHLWKPTAKQMAIKLLRRLDARAKKEPEGFIALHLLEKAGEGVSLYYGGETQDSKISAFTIKVKRWIFHTNFRATFLWTFRLRRLVWIGRHIGLGTNPDYTQACTDGTCRGNSLGCTKEGLYCTTATNCTGGSCAVMGSCACPDALPNSSQVSSCTITCTATGTCAKCVSKMCTPTCGQSVCTVGTCGYNCTAPYTWNGSACVLPPSGQQLFTLINQEDY